MVEEDAAILQRARRARLLHHDGLLFQPGAVMGEEVDARAHTRALLHRGVHELRVDVDLLDQQRDEGFVERGRSPAKDGCRELLEVDRAVAVDVHVAMQVLALQEGHLERRRLQRRVELRFRERPVLVRVEPCKVPEDLVLCRVLAAPAAAFVLFALPTTSHAMSIPAGPQGLT